ncbi:MAG: TRAP transporter large permease subunit [Formivibrio sp.]|nr:TRAP transporter large permease subunit [Formivibrio sp.]
MQEVFDSPPIVCNVDPHEYLRKEYPVVCWVDKSMVVLVGLAVITELIVLFGNVLTRTFFDHTILWANELGHLVLTVIAFVGGAVAYNRNEHIAVHAVISRLPQSWRPALDSLVDWFVLTGSVFAAYISVDVIKSRVDELSTVMEISMSWFVLPLTIGLILMAFFAVFRLIRRQKAAIIIPGILVFLMFGVVVFVNNMWGPFGSSVTVNCSILAFFILLMAVGLPVGFVLAIVATTFLYISGTGELIALPSTMESGVSNFVLLAIPFFMMAGYVMTEGGLSSRLSDFVVALVGRVRGGLYQVIIVSMYIFSGISGSKAADVAAVGTSMKQMIRDNGYDEAEFAALLSAGAVMGETIPPSLPMLVLGSITTISMGALFMGGLIPAAVIALCLMLAIYFKARISNKYPGIKMPVSILFKSSLYAIPAFLVPVLLVVGIVSGAATPTEISSVAVVYGLVLSGVFYREMTWKRLWKTVSDTAVKGGMILFITSTASSFAWTLTSADIPGEIARAMIDFAGKTDWLFILTSLIILVIMGALLEGLPALLVFAPILMPLAPQFGVSPVQYGIVLLISMGVGCFFPIIGVGMYIACSVTDVKVEAASKAMIPYVAILLIGLLLVAFVPWFSLALPHFFNLA